MTKKTINIDENHKVPLRIYIEYFFSKYKKLSSIDLTILISDLSKSDLPFKKLQSSISVNLNKLKKEGKIIKVKPKQWQLSEK